MLDIKYQKRPPLYLHIYSTFPSHILMHHLRPLPKSEVRRRNNIEQVVRVMSLDEFHALVAGVQLWLRSKADPQESPS